MNLTNESVPRVTMQPWVRFPSTWRDPVGKLLTNRRIHQLQLEGRYGPEAKRLAEEREKARQGKIVRLGGRIYSCSCGETLRVRLLGYAYLPSLGWWCPKCVTLWRDKRDRERERERELRERLQAGTLYE